jgi:hypothetical protein
MKLTDEQIVKLQEKLDQVGLSYEPLYDELLDHVCCLVEETMNQGFSFKESTEFALSKLTPKLIDQCQRDTKSLLNRNRIIMKRITLATCGLAATCFFITSMMLGQNIPSVMPLNDYEITSTFGPRMDPFTQKRKHHFGIDLKAPVGAPVIATADGTVIELKEQPEGYGKFVVISHDDQYQTRYAQLSAFKVSIGSKVKQGNVIGLVGNSGRSTAPHLHYEVIRDGKRIDPIRTIEDS